jgi:hypothetical protein
VVAVAGAPAGIDVGERPGAQTPGAARPRYLSARSLTIVDVRRGPGGRHEQAPVVLARVERGIVGMKVTLDGRDLPVSPLFSVSSAVRRAHLS